ncbi:hypothetical protein E2C01_051641 [Portunus trituberculatus]|uniref:Uncharacterized protein n=1 Tax=Portunus trituberculatus TaxID=210409 RepID=A0A5B7GJA7_PORTR|nr:hypothetical protein [Portunus trituberculatus]
MILNDNEGLLSLTSTHAFPLPLSYYSFTSAPVWISTVQHSLPPYSIPSPPFSPPTSPAPLHLRHGQCEERYVKTPTPLIAPLRE